MGGIQDTTYEGGVAVTPSDTTADPNGPFAAFYVGTSGNVTVQTYRGQKVLLKNAVAGTIYRIAISRVWSSGSAAPGDVVGLSQVPYRGST